jgi:hypothetical protein
MRDGDAFAKKFGGTSGNDPDWFKLIVKGSLGGMQNQDSVEVYLADFRANDNTQDYILKTWQFVDISNLGMYDSLHFYLSSSDVGSFGMNTPAFFCMDNFTTPFYSGINDETLENKKIKLLQNPVNEHSKLVISTNENKSINITIIDVLGKLHLNETIEINAGENNLNINCNSLKSGIYSFIISDSSYKTETINFIKE